MKGGQFLGLRLKTEKHLACEVRFARFYAYVSYGPPLICTKPMWSSLSFQRMTHEDTKSVMSFLE